MFGLAIQPGPKSRIKFEDLSPPTIDVSQVDELVSRGIWFRIFRQKEGSECVEFRELSIHRSGFFDV